MKVNGKVTYDFSFAVTPGKDKLSIDNRPLEIRDFIYVVMYKPRGVVTTCSDERGRKSIMDLLPIELEHLRPVGRLDKESEGLIILTNDGNLTQKLTHPVHQKPKRYLATVKGMIEKRDLKLLQEGIPLEDGLTSKAKARLYSHARGFSTVELEIYEGRNRQIRRMFEYLGKPVISLVRTAVGALQLKRMEPGTWRFLSSSELDLLL